MRKHKSSKCAEAVQKSLVLIICALILVSIANAPLALASTTEFNYDKSGNLVEDKNHKYEYDGFNQLKRVLDPTGKPLEEYWYNDQGQRIKKVKYNEDGTQETTYYIGKGFQRSISSEGTKDTAYVYLGGQLVAKKENGEVGYYHPDNLGSTSLVTDSEGEVVEKTSYLPFGGVDEGGLESERLYTGKELDDTGMVYFGARYYSPELARFIQPDTVQPDIYDPQQLNRYAYARNNPYKYIDPDGHAFFLPLLAVMAISWFLSNVLVPALTTELPITFAIAYDNIQNYGAGKGTAITAGEMLVGGAVGAAVGKAVGRAFGWAAKKAGSAARSVFKSAERMMASKTGALRGSRAIDEFTRNPDFLRNAKQLKSEGIATVNSFKEANALRQYAFPDAQKVPGAGPKTGPASESIFEKSRDKTIYKTDYLKDPATGRIYGASVNNEHAYTPNINIKDSFGKEYTILIKDDLTR